MTSLSFISLALSTQRDIAASRVSRKRARCVIPASMALMSVGRTSLYGGIGVLAAVLTNRLVYSPIDGMTQAQSRSDILGVIAGAALLLYGVGKAEVTDSKQAVELSGVDVRRGFGDVADIQIGYELEWAAEALVCSIPNIKSCAVFVNGVGRTFLGRFRENEVSAKVIPGGVLELALQKGERAYLADLKTVPVKDVEFGFLPSNCQAVVVQPVTHKVAIVLGADKPRPFTGADFGWLQAISDRLSASISETESMETTA